MKKKSWVVLLVVLLITLACQESGSNAPEKDKSLNIPSPYPTYTAYPTYTPFPTDVPKIPTVTETISSSPEITKTITLTLVPSATMTQTVTSSPTSVFGKTYECGDLFTIKLVKNPLMKKSLSYNTASGKYFAIPLLIENKTESSIENGLNTVDFSLYALWEGKTITIEEANWDGSWGANYGWGKPFIFSDPIPPYTPIETYVVFDVPPQITNWNLVFKPVENIFFGDVLCELEISLPEPEAK